LLRTVKLITANNFSTLEWSVTGRPLYKNNYRRRDMPFTITQNTTHARTVNSHASEKPGE